MGQTRFQALADYEEEIYGVQTGITAFAGGGQASATQLTKKYNRVDTVAAINASVKLPAALPGKECHIVNNAGLESLLVAVFPQSGEYIDGALNGSSASISYVARVPGARNMMSFACYEVGRWVRIWTPRLISLQGKFEVSEAQVQSSFTSVVTLINQFGSYVVDPVSILRSSTNGGYSGNTTGAITSDSTKVEQEHTSFDYDVVHNGLKKCIPNANGAFHQASNGLYFYTKTGNPTGAGGGINFLIAFNLYLP